MDEISRFNRDRWNALASANIAYSRPFLNLDEEAARRELDPHGVMGSAAGKNVLCLGSGGGQQSAAFAVLGAQVTVIDLSDTQLERDRQAAGHYNINIRIEQGDMRDLSRFPDGSFDLVYQPYSINFIPDPLRVVSEVARILRPGGLYRLDFANPFSMGVDEREWDGKAYPLNQIYQDGEVFYSDTDWIIYSEDAPVQKVPGPREFRHTLSTMFNGLLGAGFSLLHFMEVPGEPQAEPGSWEHFMAVAPPWFFTWWQLAAAV